MLSDEILKILDEDCNIEPEQIAVMTDSSVEEVCDAINKMKENNVLLGNKAIINWEKTHVESVTALIELKVTPQRGEGFDKVAERIYKYPQVKSLYLMSGGFDLCVIIEGKSMKNVALFVASTLAPMESVVSTATHFVLKKYKDHGTIFEDNETDDRQVITL